MRLIIVLLALSMLSSSTVFARQYPSSLTMNCLTASPVTRQCIIEVVQYFQNNANNATLIYNTSSSLIPVMANNNNGSMYIVVDWDDLAEDQPALLNSIASANGLASNVSCLTNTSFAYFRYLPAPIQVNLTTNVSNATVFNAFVAAINQASNSTYNISQCVITIWHVQLINWWCLGSNPGVYQTLAGFFKTYFPQLNAPPTGSCANAVQHNIAMAAYKNPVLGGQLITALLQNNLQGYIDFIDFGDYVNQYPTFVYNQIAVPNGLGSVQLPFYG